VHFKSLNIIVLQQFLTFACALRTTADCTAIAQACLCFCKNKRAIAISIYNMCISTGLHTGYPTHESGIPWTFLWNDHSLFVAQQNEKNRQIESTF